MRYDVCERHAGRAPVLAGSAYKCDQCGAHLVAMFCPGCQQFYPDSNFEYAWDAAKVPAPTIEWKCLGCWEDELADGCLECQAPVCHQLDAR